MREVQSTLARRWLQSWSARCALIVIAGWISVALFAPFIANDRPLWMRATDYGSFEDARASLASVTNRWLALESGGEALWRVDRRGGATQTWSDAVAAEKQALERRITLLRESLAPDEESRLAVIERFDSAAHDPAQVATPGALTALAQSTAQALSTTSGTSTEFEPRARAVQLQSRVSAPAFAGLNGFDFALQSAWLAFFLACWLARTCRRRVLSVAVVFIVATIVWPFIRPTYAGPMSIKSAAQRGDLVVDWALFPPIPMGFAETHMRDAHRAPFDVAVSPLDPGARTSSAGDFSVLSGEKHPARALPFERPIDSRWRHPLGTDSLGRDLAARLVWGARISLFVGNASALLLILIGVALGLVAGWRGGWTDFFVSRAIEIVVCFPAFVLVLCALFFIPTSSATPLFAVAIVIGVVGWTTVARLVRAETLRVRELDYVSSARALGLSETQILRLHVLPNAIQPAIIAFAFAVGAGVLTESALSFLGFGVQVPIPSWGALVSDSKSMENAWIWLIPGCAIFTLVASYNVLGEALRDALDPKHER